MIKGHDTMNQLLPFRYRLLAALVLCALFLGIGLEHTPRPVQAAVGSQFDYVDNASFGIDFDEDTNGCNNWMERSINVPDDLIILDVDFGFRAWHDYRGDIKVLLRSPAGTEVLVIDGESADNNHSYDVLLDDDSPNPLDDEDDDPIITFNGFPPSVGITTENPSSYDRTAQPSNPLTAFVGERAQGTWRVYICDDANNDDGRYFHSLIRLTGFHTVDSQLEAHWPLDETAITNTTADVSGNGHTGTKVNMAGWSTNTPPAIRFPNPAAQKIGRAHV